MADKQVTVKSDAFEIIPLEREKFIKNTLTFIAPVALVYLVYVIAQIDDGFTWSDFVPNQTVIGSMVLYFVNVLYDFLRKYVPENTYKVVKEG